MDSHQRVTADGKFFRLNGEKWYVKGFSYGPFAPNSAGEHLPERHRLQDDFAHMRELGASTLRVYFPPPVWLLDDAVEYGLRVFVDVPWEKHRCFFEDWDAQERARARIRETARTLGGHPAVFAISVANEIPNDIVRFYGHRRVARFVNQLIDVAKQESPDCLTTYVNFPTTEFLEPSGCDFCCFNVYVHEAAKLGTYLDRLQHIAGNVPLILGEYGIDTIREGEQQQAELLAGHLDQVFRHGLAGSLIFSYTDDWFTGGAQIEEWAFGVTRRDRTEKTATGPIRRIWRSIPHIGSSDWPKVSVVVCSYNGASTLRECLRSLTELDYPDYEVILVDDGSTDGTQEIADEFPQFVYHHQENLGLSAARNVGAELATGEIVAYTDSDCLADEHWLHYLIQAMQDQKVEAIGGPNITPDSDGWIAKCVAASPGNPSHVMLNDRYAEHVPGCNMAFRRDTLLGLGGFDAQFRQAGDDVDICWRLMDAGLNIGYAAGAMVWHHRRATVGAYNKQQKGYGRSEAMVHFKHPQRCGAFGRSTWKGIIYGDGSVGLPLRPQIIYHGQFGMGLFQTIYRHNHYGVWAVTMSLEWHFAAAFLLLLATLYWPLSGLSAAMWLATTVLAIRSAIRAPLPRPAPWWARPLVAYLYALQPILRGWYRLTSLLRSRRLPDVSSPSKENRPEVKRISATIRDTYWDSEQNLGREQLLHVLVEEAKRLGWSGDYHNAWASWDVKLVGDRWHDIICRTATEELGWPHRFTRARCKVKPTRFGRVLITASLVWSLAAVASGQLWAMAAGALACSLILVRMIRSRRQCLKAITRLAIHAGRLANLQGVVLTATEEEAGDEAKSASQTAEIEAKHGYGADAVASEADLSQELRI